MALVTLQVPHHFLAFTAMYFETSDADDWYLQLEDGTCLRVELGLVSLLQAEPLHRWFPETR